MDKPTVTVTPDDGGGENMLHWHTDLCLCKSIGQKAMPEPTKERALYHAIERIAELETECESMTKELAALSNPRRYELQTPSGETYKMPKDGWVCFHCGERFMRVREARAHFGEKPGNDPACLEERDARIRMEFAKEASRRHGGLTSIIEVAKAVNHWGPIEKRAKDRRQQAEGGEP